MRTPTIIGVPASASDVYETECFGPVAYLISTSGTEESIDLFRSTVQRHGAMTASVYSTSPAVIDSMRSAALDAGVALSENLLGPVFVNQSAAFSDFHGTGANPAANASYTDGAYVASRFRVVQSRRHRPGRLARRSGAPCTHLHVKHSRSRVKPAETSASPIHTRPLNPTPCASLV